MKVEEAIEVLSESAYAGHTTFNAKRVTAEKMAISAIHRIICFRLGQNIDFTKPMKEETGVFVAGACSQFLGP